MNARDKAVDLLAHYFRSAFEGAGLRWDFDNTNEIEQLVDAFHDMVTDEIDSRAADPNEPHLIEFRADGWTIQHPLRCRPKLFDCPTNRVAETDLAQPPTVLGVFECEINDLGDRLLIGDRIDPERNPS